MNNEMRVCPDCDAVEYGNLFCNTCIEEFERKMGKSEFTSTLKKINLQRKKPNKPDWEDAPEWASYLVQDRNGSWWWFEIEPYPRTTVWRSEKGRMESASFSNWEKTLEKKP